MLSRQQKYSVATVMATNSTDILLAKYRYLPEVVEFIKLISPYYKKKDGFIPKKVIKIVNG